MSTHNLCVYGEIRKNIQLWLNKFFNWNYGQVGQAFGGPFLHGKLICISSTSNASGFR